MFFAVGLAGASRTSLNGTGQAISIAVEPTLWRHVVVKMGGDDCSTHYAMAILFQPFRNLQALQAESSPNEALLRQMP